MSTNFSGAVARAFYGEPQHETENPADPERIRVATVSPASDRVLYDYANRADGDRTHAYADAAASDAQVA